jgi:hypothetical protein
VTPNPELVYVAFRHSAASHHLTYDAVCPLSLLSPTLIYPFGLPLATLSNHSVFNPLPGNLFVNFVFHLEFKAIFWFE